jgi:hypothetical protein
MAPIALTDAQLGPVRCRARYEIYICRPSPIIAERLRGRPFDDGDVWRAAVAVMREILMKARAVHQSSAGNSITAANP